MVAWITNVKICDGGYEAKVAKLLHDNSANNYASLLADEAKKDELRQLLKAEYEFLVTYGENHHIHMPPSVTRKTAAATDAASGGNKHQGGGAKEHAATYEEKFSMVREYLLEMIKMED